MLIELAEARAHVPHREPWLDHVLRRLPDYNAQMSTHATTEPDYTRLAAELNMSVGTLRRRFKAATGVTLHTHVLQSRSPLRDGCSAKRSSAERHRDTTGLQQRVFLFAPVQSDGRCYAGHVPQKPSGVNESGINGVRRKRPEERVLG
jgi:AraC-like DNA-binding protein